MGVTCTQCGAPLAAAEATSALCAACAAGTASPSSHDSGAFQIPASARADAPAARVVLPSQPVVPQRAEPPSAPPPPATEGLTLPPAADARVKLPEFQHTPPPARTATLPGRGDAPPPLPRSGGVHTPREIPAPETPVVAAPAPTPRGEGALPPHARWQAEVSLSARKISFPPQCACCLGPADGQFVALHVRRSGQRVVRTAEYSWAFPYCAACLRHVREAEVRRKLAIGAGIAAGVLLCGLGVFVGWYLTLGVVGLIAGFFTWWLVGRALRGTLAREMLAGCACAGPAVSFDGFYGSVNHFRFANAAYAAAFKVANAQKVV